MISEKHLRWSLRARNAKKPSAKTQSKRAFPFYQNRKAEDRLTNTDVDVCIRDFEDQDQFCPHCDNQYILEAKESKPVVEFDADDVRMDNRIVIDQRIKRREVDKCIDDLDWTL